MTLPAFLDFTPVPLRAQHNGWTPALQRRFVLALARGMGPDEAARSLGKTRQSAYRLRKKSGAESFAAAWDWAQALARKIAVAARSPVPGCGGLETILVPRYYRGRLIGFIQREDAAGALRALGKLDRLAERLGDGPAGAGSYRSDANPPADASMSSISEGIGQPLDEGPWVSSPMRVRVRE